MSSGDTANLVSSRMVPERNQIVDVAFGVALSALGVIGFRSTFAGNEELIVGVPAVLAGGVLGYVLARLRVPLLLAFVTGTAVFFVLGGPVALRHRAFAGFLPGPDVVVGLADGLVNGWVDLLTTLPPAGEAGDLLTIPFVCGFAGAALAVGLALRLPRSAVCALPPALVLVGSVLMGTRQPAALILQGAVFAAGTLAWLSVRHRRNREISATPMGRSRLVSAAGLLAFAALVGSFLGPALPGAEANERFVLRDRVVPPFDPLLEPSALASFRNYSDQKFEELPLFTVRGLPAGERLRIAVMDDYDGLVWRTTGSGSVVAGQFLRVGARIPAEGFGPEESIEVEVHRPEGVWVPLAGDVTSLDFTGDRGKSLDRAVRVSYGSDSAAVPADLDKGDTYRFTAEFAELPDPDSLRRAPLDGRFRRDEPDGPELYVRYASEAAGAQPTAYAELVAIAERLRAEGAYSDGGPEANPPSASGHGLARMLYFLDREQPFGNGEQFAAALGLLGRARGIPVRVVMGFISDSEDEKTFRGKDIHAWVEVPIDGLGWVPIDATPPEDQQPDPLTRPRSLQENPEPQPPPPTTIPPATSIPEELESEPDEEDERDEPDSSGDSGRILVLAALVVGIPGALFGGPALLILGLKLRRRTRRQRVGSSSERLSGSFAELVDHARDAGRPVTRQATRQEVSSVMGAPGAVALATRSDDAVFGPADPTDAEVEAAWQTFLEVRRELVADMSRAARARAALSTRSLRRLR